MAERTKNASVLIQKRLGAFQLQVDFTVQAGVLGILGPSGCGKSMTLRSIAGIVTPDSGRITLGGRTLYDSDERICLRPQKRRVGYLFQNYALFPNMTVEENIGAGLKRGLFGRRDPAQKAIIDEMVKRFRLAGLEKRYPGQLSGGQQQRVALARLLAYEPEALLLDEPFSAMDTYLREGLRLELQRMLKDYEGVTILVTHDRDEAYQLCDQLVLLDQGKVIGGGKTKELFQRPGNCRTARFIGCKNISRIRRLGKRRVLALDWGNLELETAEPVGDEITAVGIRAHDFMPLSDGQAEELRGRSGANLIPTGRASISEMPFEWYVTLENGLWWKTGKAMNTHSAEGLIPRWLTVSPDAILLLCGEVNEGEEKKRGT